MITKLFDLGQIVATPGAIEAMERLDALDGSATAADLLSRHVSGDWKEMYPEDQETNRQALDGGNRVFSEYTIDGTKFWVITERDRSVTTILLPDEY